jgi:hypothetical protein
MSFRSCRWKEAESSEIVELMIICLEPFCSKMARTQCYNQVDEVMAS